MRLRSTTAVLVAALASCTVPELDITDKECPCLAGWRCDVVANRCVEDDGSPFAPSNVGERIAWDAGSAAVVVDRGEHWVVDTDTGRIVAYAGATLDPATMREVRAPGSGAGDSGIAFAELAHAEGSLGVFSVASLEVGGGAVVIGIGSRPLVVIATREIVVTDGMITVGADRLPGMRHPGAGGAPGASASHTDGSGPGAGSNGSGDGATETGAGGGGGAGFGSAGGGGGVDGCCDTGAGGAPYGGPTLVPLAGGSGGGAGGAGTRDGQTAPAHGGLGGNGGGALQLSAGERVHVAIAGAIDARGGAGLAGDAGLREDGTPDIWHAGSGGGGGSGGAILIEAPVVTIEGAVGANGGAGGGGAGAGVGGESGAPGEPDRAPAPGGGDGGAGSDPTGEAASGATGDGIKPGGGGGGAGRIRINTAAGRSDFAGLLPRPSSGLVTFGTLSSN